MTHPDNEEFHRYGAHDYRTQNEDNRLYQEQAERQRQADADFMREQQEQADRERRQSAARDEQRQRNLQKQVGKQQQKTANQSKKSAKTATSKDEGEGIDTIIGLAGAGAGGFLALQSGAEDFIPIIIAAIVGGVLAYQFRDLIKVLVVIGIVGFVLIQFFAE